MVYMLQFNALLNSPERPTNFTIGEAGDFFRSEEYYERRKYWADYMLELCEVVKIRTLETNYAGMIATLEFLYKRFPILSTKHGISWEVRTHCSQSFWLCLIVYRIPSSNGLKKSGLSRYSGHMLRRTTPLTTSGATWLA